MMARQFDVLVVGGGPGGYALSIRLAQKGKRVACIEKDTVGGVCLNWGCIPSKALITTAQRYDWARHGDEMGIVVDGVRLDLPRAQKRNREIVKHHTGGVAALLKSNGAELVRGTAELLSARRVQVRTDSGETFELEAAQAIVIATGATVRGLRGFEPDGQRVLTAREAVFLEKLPEHLIVLGGGVIGIELGSAYQNLGSRLTIVELTGSLLPGVDADLVKVAEKHLVSRGAQILTNTRATRVEKTESGVRVEVESERGRSVIEGSVVLVAAGFVPNTKGLGLERAEVALDATGHVKIDERCETNVPGVYAIGDVAGPPYLAHKAYKEAEVLSCVLAGQNVVIDYKAMPSVIFGSPEIATVGLSEAKARGVGDDLVIGKMPFAALGRAQALAETEGFVKLIARGGRLIGAGIVGPEASELVAELTLAIEVGASLEDIALTVHTHPTLAEAVHEAAEHGLGHAVHILNRKAKPALQAAAASANVIGASAR
jgi:dihydrolipoamide dehydrogenase